MSEKPFGIQLWTLKDAMALDPRETLKHVARAGYNYIETFEGEQGMFWGMEPIRFREFVEGLGMSVVSGHCDVHNNFLIKARDAAEIGMKYLVCPWLGAKSSLEDYKKDVEVFNKCGAICQDLDIRLVYHNHDYSFYPVNGVAPIQLFFDEVHPSHLYFEMDVFWVVAAGEDPVKWLTQYPGRWPLVHIKDMKPKNEIKEFLSTELGTGAIDYSKFLKNHHTTFEYIFTEQEHFEDFVPSESIVKNAAYLRSIL